MKRGRNQRGSEPASQGERRQVIMGRRRQTGREEEDEGEDTGEDEGDREMSDQLVIQSHLSVIIHKEKN